MFKFFDFDTPIMQWLQKIANVIFCGVFWILCCIPVITAGASTTAMFRMMFNLREEKSSRIGDFFRAFKNEFGKSTLLLLLQLLTAVLIGIYLYWISNAGFEGAAMFITVAVFFVLFFFWMMTFSFVYPLTAYFENTVPKTVLNGFLMGIGNRHQSIPIMALTMTPVLIAIGTLMISWEFFFYVFVTILPIWIFVVIPLLVYVQSGLFLKVFEQYIEAPPEEKAGTRTIPAESTEEIQE